MPSVKHVTLVGLIVIVSLTCWALRSKGAVIQTPVVTHKTVCRLVGTSLDTSPTTDNITHETIPINKVLVRIRVVRTYVNSAPASSVVQVDVTSSGGVSVVSNTGKPLTPWTAGQTCKFLCTYFYKVTSDLAILTITKGAGPPTLNIVICNALGVPYITSPGVPLAYNFTMEPGCDFVINSNP